MDSFYDQPRRAPMQRTPLTSTDNLLPSHVPDVSMLQQNRGTVFPQRTQMSYNAWKVQQKNQNVVSNTQTVQPNFTPNVANKENNLRPVEPNFKENMINKGGNLRPMQPSLYRKQVRFESPRNQSSDNTNNKMAAFAPTGPILRQSSVNTQQKHKAFESPRKQISDNTTNRLAGLKSTGHNDVNLQQSNNILQSKPFEKIYMANIPNRCLDLSIIEPPRTTVVPAEKVAMKVNQYTPQKPPHIAESTTIETKQSSDDPSVKDLLKIIQQQNEQLMTLQKQVNTLLHERSEITSRKVEEPIFKNKHLESRNPTSKFAIDVMTSFEVSIRPPNNFANRKFNRDYISNEPKIREIIEDKNEVKPTSAATSRGIEEKKGTDVSLTLNEPLLVREECPSPENSIHIDMQDFSSSESEDEGSNHSSLIGWTIYNNVMDQVNFIIKKSQGDEQCKIQANNKFGTAAMQKVKEATIKHLKNVGVNLPNMEDSESTKNDSGLQYSPTEISFAVKQLLMKYLPNEHLAKIKEPNKKPDLGGNYPTNLITRRPDFSLATVQYMEKYNLLNKGGPCKTPKRDGKLLDITALKQQPKLL